MQSLNVGMCLSAILEISSSRVALSNLSQRPHPMSSSTYPLVMTNIAMV